MTRKTDREFIDAVDAQPHNAGKDPTTTEYLTLEEIAKAWRLPKEFVRRLFHQLIDKDGSGGARCYPRARGYSARRIPLATFDRFRRLVNEAAASDPYPEVIPPAKLL